MPLKFLLAQLPPYHEQADLMDIFNNLNAFTNWGMLYGYSDTIIYRALVLFFVEATQTWYERLKPGLTRTFEDLSTRFANHFHRGHVRKKAKNSYTVKQELIKSYWSLIKKFHDEVLLVENLRGSIALESA